MVTQQDFTDVGLGSWVVEGTLARRTYDCDGFTAGGALVARIAELADTQNHHPDVTLAYPGTVTVTTTSHDSGGLTGRDLTLARSIEESAGA